MSHTSRRVSSGFGENSSLPLTKSMYKGGSCSTKGRTCFIMGGLTFSSCFKVISACNYLRLVILKVKRIPCKGVLLVLENNKIYPTKSSMLDITAMSIRAEQGMQKNREH